MSSHQSQLAPRRSHGWSCRLRIGASSCSGLVRRGLAGDLHRRHRSRGPRGGPRHPTPDQAGLAFDELSPSEKIYRRVAQMTKGVSYDATSATLPIRKRVSVDIISGTSAGGINGIFLAKALANDAPLDAILNLWIEEGDLGKLLNDAESVKDEQ